MTVSTPAGAEIPEAATPLLNDVVPCSVNFNGQQSVRSKSGCWRSASFLTAVGLAERFAYYGVSLNMVTYLTGNFVSESTAEKAEPAAEADLLPKQ